MADHEPNWTALLLSLMMVLVPALGMPNEDVLQDTLKSILVSLFTLAACFSFFWSRRSHDTTLGLHQLLWLPLLLMAYALGSMAWSHTYLGGVEVVRWLVFSLIVFIGMNTLTLHRVTRLAWGIHLGAMLAGLWAALQFWFDWQFFAQSHDPASTFVNRNFFAEFMVCALPFSALLLTRVRDKTAAFLIVFSTGFNMVALLMTGARSALFCLCLLALLIPACLWTWRRQWVSTGWRAGHGLALAALLVATVLAIGSIHTANPKLIGESGRGDALDRAFRRSLSVAQPLEYSEGSFWMRKQMWKASARMIATHPVTGVGAGAWEVEVPRYQQAGSQLEIDYYAHNEPLQLVAEYGLTGWIFLVGLIWYLVTATCKTWTDRSAAGQREAPLRAFTLISLWVLLLVSNTGFAWRLASTGALFALGLSILAASDLRLASNPSRLAHTVPWRTTHSLWALCATAIGTALALYISQQAIECESKLVEATRIGLAISKSGHPNDPRWDQDKAELLQLVREGIAINPHYRKITPIAADAMASWGDWKNASWVWESVIQSRPYIVVILANLARGYLHAGDAAKAQQYFDRAKNIQPSAPTLASLEVLLLARTGQQQQAAVRATQLLQGGLIDDELVQTAYGLGIEHSDPALAILALQLGIKAWPERAVDGWLKLGALYDSPQVGDEGKALQSYQAALDNAQPRFRSATLAAIPPKYRARLTIK